MTHSPAAQPSPAQHAHPHARSGLVTDNNRTEVFQFPVTIVSSSQLQGALGPEKWIDRSVGCLAVYRSVTHVATTTVKGAVL